MNDADVLLTISEVSVAFAGFASLVSVLGQRHSREHFDLNIARLRGMLEISLMVLLLSLAPFLPAKFGASEATSWRLSSLAFVLLVLLRIYVALPRSRLPGVSLTFVVAIWSTQVVCLVLLSFVVFGIANELASALYLAALFVYLCFAAVLFLRLVLALIASQRPAA